MAPSPERRPRPLRPLSKSAEKEIPSEGATGLGADADADAAPPAGPPLAGPATRPAPRGGRGRGPSTVVVSFEGPGPQRRLTIAFRIILAIPHLVYFYVLSLVAVLAAVVAWFCALVLGRLPAGFATFLGRVVQYGTRVWAYGFFLLTDRYPPFSLSEADYAVSVELTPGRLNRAAVLFRFILFVPATIVVNILFLGFQ